MKFLTAKLSVGILLLFFPLVFVLASEIIVTDADTVWGPDLITAPSDVIDSTDALAPALSEAYVNDADSVWSFDLPIISSDVTDASDALPQYLTEAFVSHTDTFWSPNLTIASPDVIDSTDAPLQTLSEAYVSHADTVWTIGLEKSNFEAPPPEPEKWSFAIITDLHIGFDIPDYDGYSYNDISTGQDYYLSKRLEAVIDRINELKDDYNIKFLAVLGDISDTAEYSELIKTRDILNKLEIPYIPLIGNHDVWPYTQKEGIDPDDRGEENHATIANSAIGDEYFEGIFWCSFDTIAETKEECLAKNKNPQKIRELFTNTWKRQEDLENYKGPPYLQNYVFDYGGMNFIVLDTNKTEREKKPGSVMTPFFINLFPTIDWYQKSLKKEPTILFSHHPNKQWQLFLSSEVYFSFAGHIHQRLWNDNDERLGSIITEAVLEEYENVIRIVRVKNIEKPVKEDIDYSKIEGIPKEIAPDEIKRPDPYIIFTPSNPAPNEEITFIAKDETREKDIKSCKWDFGDGFTDNSGKCEVTHSYSSIFLWRYTVKVIITYIDDTQRITEKSLWVTPKFKLKVPTFIFPSLLINEEINVAQVPQNTPESVFITKTASEKKPIGILGIHFEEATEDIDLLNLVADINLEARKSILYMPQWPEVIEEEKVIFIPSTGIGIIYLCPYVTSMSEVTPLCEDIEILDVEEIENNIFVDTIIYNGREYYMVYGIKGTGGGEFGQIEESIKNLNGYIQGLPDEDFKNNPNQRKNALQNKLEEIFLKIDNSEYQDAINKLRNDIRAKADGTVDGKSKDDWIAASVAQREICTMIDNLISHLQDLL